ncbi:hypothetical protein SDRG_09538 [Saprolegnia diclina VS20]|uniref:Uncharacterized protein n=1 Tax=Saprolegnia diclina (strain VS20) TaxID=1156394 RepID=T0RL77_SAPDV|nr:hypothetical protein SDRG_09538 [Saprolegnia diclina VS20]EQC33018.1 hypothetical protein SDRG_09538 [Saprolegnia diclina VS20]|eukprot:XP_008613704.1 hypothetical protein SDRG_09538 [Saprolegnia diclina VS20]
MAELLAGLEWQALFKAMARHVYVELRSQLRTNDEWAGRFRAALLLGGVSGVVAAGLVCYRRRRKMLRAPSHSRLHPATS